MAIAAKIHPDDVPGYLRSMEIAFEKAQFNDKAKFGLLRDALKSIPKLLQLMIYRGASTYEELKNTVLDYENGRLVFYGQTANMAASASVDPFGSKRILSRPDARGAELESKVDALANSLAGLCFLLHFVGEEGNRDSHSWYRYPGTEREGSCLLLLQGSGALGEPLR